MARSEIQKLPAQSNIRNDLQYCVASIRSSSCANSVHGVKASVILYNLAKTAKTNNPPGYEYLEYLLDELALHVDNTKRYSLKNFSPDQMLSRINATS